jgi:hypothetical protein
MRTQQENTCNISKYFGDFRVLNNLSITVPQGGCSGDITFICQIERLRRRGGQLLLSTLQSVYNWAHTYLLDRMSLIMENDTKLVN